MPKRIIVTGSIASVAGYGGHAWAVLQYVIGFGRLGFETFYVEELRRDLKRSSSVEPLEASVHGRIFRDVERRFGLEGRAALLVRDRTEHMGMSLAELEKLAPDAELLVNRSGRFQRRSVTTRVRRRLYLDVDPGYTQVWQARYGVDMNLYSHDVHVTVGLNLGGKGCPFPTCGIRWNKTLPPVVLGEWTTTRAPRPVWSTVADWRGFGLIEWDGRWYGPKADAFRPLLPLPARTSARLELCLLVDPAEADREALRHHGWRVESPAELVATPDGYREYIFDSRGEFSAVKQAYAAGTGWFSDRSACYLAAGRPVVLEETGFSDMLPTGVGLLSFRDLDSAAEALARVESDYEHHAHAAASLAREYLDSDRVLAGLLTVAGL